MKVFIGTNDIARILTGFKEGFQSIGCDVTTLVREKHPFYKVDYDHVIPRKFKNSHSISNQSLKKIVEFTDFNIQNIRIKRKLSSFIEDHDVFVFIWQSLQKNSSDYELIKKANKKIVTVFVGSDVRHISAFKQEFGNELLTWEKGFHYEDINTKIHTLRIAELYSDLILSVPDQAGLAIRPYDHLYLPFDATKIQFKITDNTPLKIIHAPSRSGLKGTSFIKSAVERLQQEDISVEFKFLQNISNVQLMEELRNADILIDELYLHGPGMLSLEAMASGCAVATHTMLTYKDVFDPPVCNINESNIYDQLKILFTDKAYRMRLIEEGKKFVTEKNAPAVIAKNILNTLNSNKNVPDYVPDFFLNHYKLPSDSVISEKNMELTQQVIEKYKTSTPNKKM